MDKNRKKTLIVVDMQNDFIDGALGTKEAVAIVENVKEKIKEYKENIDVLRSIVYKDNLFTNEENCKIDVTEFKESYLLGAAMVPLEEFLN